ncbi:hypothetical protein GCM10027594_32470 [Hymenobacter agri]
MSKIPGLQDVNDHIHTCRFAYLRTLLYQERDELTAEQQHDYQFQIGHMTILLEELKDHLYNLRGLATACAHGLAGTQPDDYEPWEEDADGNDVEVPYDPYAEMAYHLSGESSVRPLRLSTSVLAYIDQMPLRDQLHAEGFLQLMGGELSVLQQGVPGTDSAQYANVGISAALEALESTAFVLTYEADLARVEELVITRGPLEEIAALLGPVKRKLPWEE